MGGSWVGENVRIWFETLEAVFQKRYVKKVFLKISQTLQENTCVGLSF